MSNKLAGIRLENKIKKDYEALGNIVLHTKGSFGFCDLVVIAKSRVHFVSIKRALKRKYIKARMKEARTAIPKEVKVRIKIMVYCVEDKQMHVDFVN